MINCLQFEINGKIYQFRGVSIEGNPSLIKILNAINRSNYRDTLEALVSNLDPQADFDEISITDYTEAGNYVLGNLSLMDLQAVKAKYGHLRSDHLNKIISLLANNKFNIFQSNIRVANSIDKKPTIYLGSFRNLINIDPETSEADLSSALSYAFIDDQLREALSPFTGIFNEIRRAFSEISDTNEDTRSAQRELNLLPDDINKNKRMLYYINQGVLNSPELSDFNASVQTSIQNILNDYLAKTEILDKIDQYNTVKELIQVFPINPEGRIQINDITVNTQDAVDFSERLNQISQQELEQNVDYVVRSDQQIANHLGLDSYIEGSFPEFVLQREFLFNLEERFIDVARALYRAEYKTSYLDEDFYTNETLNVNKIINKALINNAENIGRTRDAEIATRFLMPKANVLFEQDLLVRSKRNLKFYDDRKRINRGATQLRISNAKAKSDNYLYINTDLKVPKINNKIRTLAILSKDVSNLSDEAKRNLLQTIKDNSRITTVNLDGEDMNLVNIVDSLGFNINIFSDQWKNSDGGYSREAYLRKFDNIKLNKTTNSPLTPIFKFYKKNSRGEYYFGGNNVTEQVQRELTDNVSHVDLVKNGTLTALLIPTNQNNKPLLAQEVNTVFDLQSRDTNDKIRMQITNKSNLSSFKREADNDSLGTVYTDPETLNKYIRIGEAFHGLNPETEIRLEVGNMIESYKAPYKEINGNLMFRVEGGTFTTNEGFSDDVAALQSYYNEELVDISNRTGYSLSFLMKSFFDKTSKFDTNWVYDIDTNITATTEEQFDIPNFDANGLVATMIQDLGIKVNMINKSDYGKDVNAYVKNGEIYLVRKAFNNNSLLHELTHILLGNIKLRDYNIYQGLLDLVQDSDVDRISPKYPNMSQNDLREEALVTLFAETFTDKVTNNPNLEQQLQGMDWPSRLREVLKLNRNPEQPVEQLMNSTIQVVLNNYGSNYNELFRDIFSPSKSVITARLSNLKQSLIEDGTLKEIPC